MKCSDSHIKGRPPVSLGHPWVPFWSYPPLSPRPRGGITQCAHRWKHRLPPAGCAAALHQSAVSRGRLQQNVKPVTGGSHRMPFCLISLVEHVGAVVVPCFGISAFDKEASSDHCWFLFFSFVQSRNSFLVFSDSETNRRSWWKFRQYRQVWSRKYSAPTPRDSTAHPSLYTLRESLPFKCRMSIVISFYLKTLFLQKFSTSSAGLIPPWPGWTWITIVRNIFEREEPKYIHD